MTIIGGTLLISASSFTFQVSHLVLSYWSDNSVSISCLSADSNYHNRDTARFTITVRNHLSEPIFISRHFEHPKIDTSNWHLADFRCWIALAFEWWFGSDPLVTGIGPHLLRVGDSATVVVSVPLSPFKVTPWDKKVYIQVFFCYIRDLSGLESLLSANVEDRRIIIDGAKYLLFEQRLIQARLNPVLIEMH